MHVSSTQCSKHVEAYNKLNYKTRICALSWSITKIILRYTVSKTTKFSCVLYFYRRNHVKYSGGKVFKLSCSRNVKRGLNLGILSLQSRIVISPFAKNLNFKTHKPVILPSVLYECETRLHENYSCTMFEGKVTKIIFRTQTN